MNNINVIGVDLAKNIFQIYGEDENENKVVSHRFKRKKFQEFMRQLPACKVGMEACGTAHYWGRYLEGLGHEVKIIHPRRVKAFIIRNKNDAKDAEGICDATKNKKIPSIPVKTLAQQNLTTLHRARSQVMRRRVQLVNHLRSQLAEYGLVTRQGFKSLRELVVEVLGGEHITLEQESLFVMQDLYEEWQRLNKRIQAYDEQVRRVAKGNKSAKKIMQIPGIGEMTATAIIAKVEDFTAYEKGRDFSAWLGLTPKEYSSAEKRRLGGISKQGDRYIRTLLIHGARAAITAIMNKGKNETAYHRWIQATVERVGKNKAVVALANKHGRMIWALLRHGRELNLNFSDTFKKEAACV
jgi:transposase